MRSTRIETFTQLLHSYDDADFEAVFSSVTEGGVRQAINRRIADTEDLLALLSPAAEGYLEEMALKARELTTKQFGKVIFLYTPLYLSDYCINSCLYCGFNTNNTIQRTKLSLDEIKKEGEAIAASGMQHLLLLTGESRKHTPVSYIRECISVLQPLFSSISLEIYPLEEEEYRELCRAGADGVTIYQEVYHQETYRQLHPAGPKKNFEYRLATPERVSRSGMRTINIGALFGLHDFRSEAFFAGLHANFLQNRYPEMEVGISVPRMRPHTGSFQPHSQISDRNLVQAILAFRLFLPRVGITVSTRERAELRDNLLPLGVTKMSAGSRTMVGGHALNESGTGQFEIADHRDEKQMREMLLNRGYQPVFKDW